MRTRTDERETKKALTREVGLAIVRQTVRREANSVWAHAYPLLRRACEALKGQTFKI